MGVIRLLLVLALLAGTPALAFMDAISSQTACGTSSAVIRPKNGTRLTLHVRNLAAQAVYICFRSTCTTTTGTLLVQNAEIEDLVYTGPISCITSTGSTTVGVLEAPAGPTTTTTTSSTTTTTTTSTTTTTTP